MEEIGIEFIIHEKPKEIFPHIWTTGVVPRIHNEKNCTIEHFHFYPFGGFKKTAIWVKSLEEGNFTLNGKGGFVINEG